MKPKLQELIAANIDKVKEVRHGIDYCPNRICMYAYVCTEKNEYPYCDELYLEIGRRPQLLTDMIQQYRIVMEAMPHRLDE
jgi:hypothetical protein